MFKRANKITSLLVVAASIISLVPAGVSAADAKRIESEDGTIYDAAAYKDGKFYIDGKIRNKDEGAYYLNGDKFTELEDVGSGDTFKAYGSKYLEYGDEDYYLDLSKGKETDDSIEKDAIDDAATALRKKVKSDNDGRYTEKTAEDIRTLEEVPGSKFGSVYYATQYDADSKDNSTPGKFNVVTDDKGGYIDLDHKIGKIKIGFTDGSNDKLEDTENDDKLSAKVRADESYGAYGVIGQDSSYVYRIADITFKSNKDIKEINGIAVNKKADAKDDLAFDVKKSDATSPAAVTFKVIQKISKAQDGDVSGAKTPKSVTSYILSDADGVAKKFLGSEESETDRFTVVNGKIVNYVVKGDSVKAKTITLKSKNGYYYTDISDPADADIDDEKGWDVDVDGNVWVVSGGYVRQFNNDDDWDKVYKVDGSFDKLSVYDKNNMVVWNEGDEVYSLISSKAAEETTETPVVTTGWVKAADGTWTYVKADGTKSVGWLNLNGVWYYLKADGIMATGWINDNGTWYYLNASGAMQTGWLNDNGTWYYLSQSGAMLANTTVDGYVLGASGAWIK